jgi:hypothetical protein
VKHLVGGFPSQLFEVVPLAVDSSGFLGVDALTCVIRLD